jgi:SecD/SecF fusion protein
MNRSHLWKLLLILFAILYSVYYLYPPTDRPTVDAFKSQARNRDTNFNAIVQRAEQLNKANPQRAFANLKEAVGTNDITRYFPQFPTKAEKDPNMAVLYRVQREAAGRIRLGLDLRGGTSFLVAMDTNQLSASSQKDTALANAVEVLRRRVDRLGVAEPLIQPSGQDRILIQLPGLSEADKESARRQIEKAAFLEFRMVHPNSDELLAQGIIEPGHEIMTTEVRGERGEKALARYLVSKKPEKGLTGKYVKHANIDRHPVTGEPLIAFEFDSEGAKLFADITREYAPKGNKHYILAIVLDGELRCAPRINEPIEGGRGQITGNFDVKEAKEIANVLENPLEAPVKVIEERSVDPSLGKDSIRSGVKASFIGIIAVAGFMIVYYLFSGGVAVFAMLLNVLILLGIMCSVGTTLTLPGIAGIVLTVGMSVDANVLIFERIREELAAGKSLRGALQAGYSKAFGTIFDSHVTTLISSIILIIMGTGPVKGFGVALTIIDFMRWAKPAFVLSWLLILIGIGYGVYRGRDVFGVEFLGGDSMTVTFTQKVEVDKLRDTVTKVGFRDALIAYQRDISTGKDNLRITVRGEHVGQGEQDVSQKVIGALKQQFPQSNFQMIGLDQVGPTVGKEIQRTAVIASLLAMLGILVYVAFRYEFSFSVGAVVAIIHDVLMTLGWFFLTGRELSAAMVAAVLTIIGFSINDTIVIFDRIREDLKLGVRGTFRELINKALNQTLSRTIITSGTVFLATLSLYIFGGGVINDFAFTFLVGIITGTYSSIYIASALVLWWHKGQRPQIGSALQVTGEPAAAAKPPQTVRAA